LVRSVNPSTRPGVNAIAINAAVWVLPFQLREEGVCISDFLLILIYLSTAIGLTPGGSGTLHTINT